jgi:negative regulator of flagellin synthesis FlgM
MNIDSIKTPGLNGTTRAAAKAGSPTTSPATNSAPASSLSGDVRLSSASATLNAQEPSVNMARVLEIRSAIAEGRFEINAAAIADRLITTARELVGTRRQA